MEQTVTCLSIVQKFIQLQPKILRLFKKVLFRKYFKIFFSKYHEKNGINGHIYDSSADYDAIDVYEILDICKYLMRKNDIAYNVWFY